MADAPPREVPLGGASPLNHLPVAVMVGGWLSPLLIFWGEVWGPIRRFDLPPPTGPSPLPYLLLLAASFLAAWAPRAYLRTRAWERRGSLYRAMGVRAFRALVPNGDWIIRLRRRRAPGFRVVAGRRAADVLREQTIQSERGHLVFLLMGTVSSVYAWRIGWTGWALFLAVGNIVVNLYPILLQRYTRARIDGMLGTIHS